MKNEVSCTYLEEGKDDVTLFHKGITIGFSWQEAEKVGEEMKQAANCAKQMHKLTYEFHHGQKH